MATTFKRRMLRWFLLASVALLALIGFLPTLVGSRWIYRPLIEQLANDQFRLTIDKVRLRWFSPLRLEGIQLSEATGPSLLTIRQVSTDRGLFGYLVGGRKLGRLLIDEPTVSLELLQDGSNLERVIQAIDKAASRPDKGQRSPPAFDIDVSISRMSAKVVHENGLEPLVVVPPFDIAARYQAASGDSRLIIQPTRILDQVKLTKELIDLGLGHAVPLLAKSAWFDGRISLDIGRIDVPLKTPKQTQAELKLTLHEVRSGPNDPAINRALDFIARLRGRDAFHELVFVDGSVIDVAVSQGKVKHSGLEFGFPKMDSRFQIATSGTVGIEDKSLDLLVQVPVPIEQLARRESVQQLGVPTLKLPITGTLDQPHLNWDAMRGDAATLLGSIQSALGEDAPTTAKIVGALEGLAGGQADEAISATVDLIEQIRERRKAKQQAAAAAQPSEPGKPGEPDEKKNQPVRDAIRDLFRRKE